MEAKATPPSGVASPRGKAAVAPVRAAQAADRDRVLALLAAQAGLEVAFDPAEFHVVGSGGDVVACGRLRVHPDGALELASVATDAARRGEGLASQVVESLLRGAKGPVYALALAPGFFARHGFREVPRSTLPA